MTRFDCELTDLYCGEANYSWVRRVTIETPDNASRRSIVMAAKRALGLTGVKCRTSDNGDGWELRPQGLLQVAFITPYH